MNVWGGYATMLKCAVCTQQPPKGWVLGDWSCVWTHRDLFISGLGSVWGSRKVGITRRCLNVYAVQTQRGFSGILWIVVHSQDANWLRHFQWPQVWNWDLTHSWLLFACSPKKISKLFCLLFCYEKNKIINSLLEYSLERRSSVQCNFFFLGSFIQIVGHIVKMRFAECWTCWGLP